MLVIKLEPDDGPDVMALSVSLHVTYTDIIIEQAEAPCSIRVTNDSAPDLLPGVARIA